MLSLSEADHSLLDTIVEDLLLLRPWREDPVESEAISLWTRAKLRRADVTCLEIIIEGHYDVSTLPLLNGIWRPKSACMRRFDAVEREPSSERLTDR